ncbi:MAG: methyltransferase [Rhodospirillaceae bacterium]|nr:methyltransferase [Rhodospirillaceae bacterium]
MTLAATETHLLGGRVRCFQPAKGYRTAIDAVLLAAAVPANPGERVLDVGTGVGASAFCLAARVADVNVVGLELQTPLAQLAQQGIKANEFGARVQILTGDLLAPPSELEYGSFDHVMTNPPYMPAGKGHPPPDPMKATAMVEGAATLALWLAFCAGMVKDGGSVTVIHRADRLDEVLRGLELQRCGATDVLPVAPIPDAAAKRVIVRGRKGSDAQTVTHLPLVLHTADMNPSGHRRAYSPAADTILRDAQTLL